MDFTVEKLPQQRGREYIKNHHYSGGCSNSAMIWGLKDGDQILGAIAFATPISENTRKSILEDSDDDNECWCNHIDDDHKFRSHVTELHRLYTDDNLPDGTESWFISKGLDALKDYKPKYWCVISFADSTEGHIGKVYQAANAHYYGTGGAMFCYKDETGRLRHARQNSDRITQEQAEERGWERVERETKHRYLFFLPDGKRHREWLLERTQVDLQEYPDDIANTATV